jgi:hypothetical protein
MNWWIALLIGCIPATLLLLTQYAIRMHRPQTKFLAWRTQLERTVFGTVESLLEAAERQAECEKLIGELPPDFTYAGWQALRLGYGLERAVLVEAERRGLVPQGTLEQISAGLLQVQPNRSSLVPTGAPPILVAPTTPYRAPAPAPLPPPQAPPVVVASPPTSTVPSWAGGPDDVRHMKRTVEAAAVPDWAVEAATQDATAAAYAPLRAQEEDPAPPAPGSR